MTHRWRRAAVLAPILWLWTVESAFSAPPRDVDAEVPCGLAAEIGESLDAWFWRGRCAADQNRHAEAVVWFTRILEIADAGRTRLELARSMAALGRLDEARQQYRAVLESDPPPTIRSWVQVELAQVVKDVSPIATTIYKMGLGALWDSNLNTGPSDPNIILFGLPFQLTPASLRSADSGITSWAGVEHHTGTAFGLLALSGRIDTTRYRSLRDHDNRQGMVQANIVRSFGTTQWTATALVDEIRNSGGNRTNIWLAVQAMLPVEAQQSVVMQVIQKKQRSEGDISQRSQLLSWSPTWMVKLGAGIDTAFSLRNLREISVDSDHSHQDWGIQAEIRGMASMLCNRCSWALQGNINRAMYKADDMLFDIRRSDRQNTILASFGGIWNGGDGGNEINSWSARVEWGNARSNIPIFSYRRTRVTLANEWLF